FTSVLVVDEPAFRLLSHPGVIVAWSRGVAQADAPHTPAFGPQHDAIFVKQRVRLVIVVDDPADAIDDEDQVIALVDPAVVANLDQVVLAALPIGPSHHQARSTGGPLRRWSDRTGREPETETSKHGEELPHGGLS